MVAFILENEWKFLIYVTMENVMSEHKKADWGDELESGKKGTETGQPDSSRQKKTEQEGDCKSQSLRSQVREEHAMNNDVEPLHSEGDEPDLVKYLKERKGE